MWRRKKIKVNKIKKYFIDEEIDDTTLNRLFYYSLFDSSNFEDDEDFFPAVMVKDFKNKTRELLRRLFSKRKHPEIYDFLDSHTFPEFEKRVIATDVLSRIILSKKLLSMGIKVKIKKDDIFDLEFKDVKIELKRICLWTNYSEYLSEFLRKVDGNKALFVVAYTNPFNIDKIIPTKSDMLIFKRYIKKIVESHYAVEKIISDKNVKLVMGYIDKNGVENLNLSSLCNKIVQKIKDFED